MGALHVREAWTIPRRVGLDVDGGCMATETVHMKVSGMMCSFCTMSIDWKGSMAW
jgi:hypothetical protein